MRSGSVENDFLHAIVMWTKSRGGLMLVYTISVTDSWQCKWIHYQESVDGFYGTLSLLS